METALRTLHDTHPVNGRFHAVTIMEVTDKPAPWYNGILQEDTSVLRNPCVQIVDKGGSIEFSLPRATAQFTEMTIFDRSGAPVWKTQSFNESTIAWHKQTTSGNKVPHGTYTFVIRQGRQEMSGRFIVSR